MTLPLWRLRRWSLLLADDSDPLPVGLADEYEDDELPFGPARASLSRQHTLTKGEIKAAAEAAAELEADMDDIEGGCQLASTSVALAGKAHA